MSKQAIEFVKIVANNPEWMTDPEKRNMIAKMAKRISEECKRCRRNDDTEIKKGVKGGV
jgi:hypothetical protein